jgi:hypothetical protein
MRNLKIETSTDGGTTWTDASGATNSITVDGGEREIGTFFDAQNDTPTLGVGKRSELELKVRVKYTEVDDDGFDTFAQAYESGDPIMVRYAPKGAATGARRYTSGAGYVKTNPYPGGEVESGDPLRCEFSVVVPSLTKSTVA